ncbi:MAG: peptidylprolyl isomerase [Gammaproteobacteria bacterium]|nr:peptidylprolyl isomerase [Gammaproteobacteria bacterium]
MNPRSVNFGLISVSLTFALALSCLPASIQAQELPADAIATVNGQSVLKETQDAVVRQLRQNGQPVDADQIRSELINLELLTQKAEAQDLHNRKDIAALLRLQYIQNMAQAYMAALSEEVSITEEVLKAEYELQTAALAVDEYRASHILLDDEASAQGVIEKLNGGAEFAALAKTESTGPTGPNGGDLGWFQAQTMVPEFSAAVKTMSVGDFSSAPVKSEFGWHVILLVDKRGSQKPAYEDIKGELRNIVLRKELTVKIDQMRAEADIKVR